MKGFLLSLTVLYNLILPLLVQAQNCGNIGFEDGSTDGWVLSNGKVSDKNMQTIFSKDVVGSYGNGHLITTLNMGNDPSVKIENLPMVAPGSRHSIRIGNDQKGSRFDRITTTFLVTAENALFQYKFAIVLQDPNHKHFQQPAFRIRIGTLQDSIIACGYYEVSAGRGLPGFKEQPNVNSKQQRALTFRNWTTSALDLTRFIGTMVSVEVTTNDCTEGAHYGYSYFDAQCLKMEIAASTQCPKKNTVINLTAPEGFESYLWSTGERTREIKASAEPGKKYYVKVKPYSSLDESCNIQLDYVIPSFQPELIQYAVICAGDGFVVGNSVYVVSGTYLDNFKRNNQCDSLVTTVLTVNKPSAFNQDINICEGKLHSVGDSTYKRSGTYLTRIKRIGKCDSLVTTKLTITNPPTYIQNVSICAGDSFTMGDSTYSTSGEFVTRIRKNGECDSVVVTNLTIKNIIEYKQNITICFGETYKIGDSLYSKSGVYTNRIIGANTCDSLVTTDLTVEQRVAYTQDIEICEQESITVGTQVFTSSGQYITRIARPGKCDSLVTTNLVVRQISIIIPPNISLEPGDSILITPRIEPGGAYRFYWFPNEGLVCDTCSAAWLKPKETTTYTLRVETDNYACSKEVTTKVTVNESCFIYVPDAFTPDGEAPNEILELIGGDCLTLTNFSIYNKWGEVIFYTNNKEEGWDGTYKGIKVPPGQYAYKLETESARKKGKLKYGSVLLIR